MLRNGRWPLYIMLISIVRYTYVHLVYSTNTNNGKKENITFHLSKPFIGLCRYITSLQALPVIDWEYKHHVVTPGIVCGKKNQLKISYYTVLYKQGPIRHMWLLTVRYKQPKKPHDGLIGRVHSRQNLDEIRHTLTLRAPPDFVLSASNSSNHMLESSSVNGF